MQARVRIINDCGEIETAVAVDIRLYCKPSHIVARERRGFVSVGDKINGVLEVCVGGVKFKDVAQRNGLGVVFFPSAVHADGFTHFGVVISVDENFFRDCFVNVTSVVPTAMVGVDGEFP